MDAADRPIEAAEESMEAVVIVLALTLLQLWLSKRWVHYEQA